MSGVVFNQGVAGGMTFEYAYSYTTGGRVSGNQMLAAVSGSMGPAPIDLKAQYAWDTQGRVTSLTYPSGPVLTYQFDAMGRPTGLTGTPTNRQFSASATYGSAGQLLSVGMGEVSNTSQGNFTYYANKNWQYNNMLQVTNVQSGAGELGVAGNGINVDYVYNVGHNNGRVIKTIDHGLNETVDYTYDYLHRLATATAENGSWGEQYAYDGFGNLTDKTPTVGSAPAWGFPISGISATTWDIEHQLTSSNVVQVATTQYGYDPWGRRIFSQVGGAALDGSTNGELWFYGADGKKLETYHWINNTNGLGLSALEGINRYFAGVLLEDNGKYMATDRLGSARAFSDTNALVSYFPWGEERPQANGTTTPDGRVKFAGYFRDTIGQNYAMARYYSEANGSFWSPDPGSLRTADSTNPTSWNRNAYATGDPVNRIDPMGLVAQAPASAQDCINSDGTAEGCYDPCMPLTLSAIDAPMPSCEETGGDEPIADPEPDPTQPDCNSVLEADLANYLGSYRGGSSPLNNWTNIDAIVQAGMDYDVDPRLIVGLAVADSQGGTTLTWGPYNAWNNRAYRPPNTPYSSWGQAITSVALLADKYISGNGLTTTATFYSVYQGPHDQKGLKNLNSALTSMGGKTDQLTDPCNPANARSPNK